MERLAFHLAEFLPLAVFWLVARGQVRRAEDWGVAAVFAVSFVADSVARGLMEAGHPTWIVMVVYPVFQAPVLAWAFMERWAKWRRWVTGMCLSVAATVSGLIVFREVARWLREGEAYRLPAYPEMGVVAIASVLMLWLVWARRDLGLLRWSVFMAFGATLPAAFAMRPLFDAGLRDWYYYGFKIPFTVGILLACVSFWRTYRKKAVVPKGRAEPPPALEMLRTVWVRTLGRA